MSIKTKAVLQAEIDAQITANGSGAITGTILNAILIDLKDSYEDFIVSMDTATRDALTPASRLLIFNTDLIRFQIFYLSAWWTIPLEKSGLFYGNQFILKHPSNTDMNASEDDDWRIIVNGENLDFDRKESAAWVNKWNFTP